MYYQWVVLTLFSIFDGQDVLEMTLPSQSEYAHKVRLHSAKEIARYSRIQRQMYGLSHVPYDMLQSTSAGLLVLLGDLCNAESQAAFIEVSRFLAALSQRLKLGKGVLHLLETTTKQSGINLPSSVLSPKDPESESLDDIDAQESTNVPAMGSFPENRSS